MNKKKLNLLNDANRQLISGPSTFSHILFAVIFVFIIISLIWANYAILDEVTTGQGKVIPSQEVQVIQNLEGGIVRKILVKEGQIVQKDQILMQIDDTRFQASYKEAQKKMASLEIDILRLTAELNDKPFEISLELKKENPSLTEAKKLLYEARIAELNELKNGLSLIQKEVKMTAPLVSKGAVSEVELLRIKRSENELKSKILIFKRQALSELNQAKSELSALKESYVDDKERVTRTTVRAPLKGIIKQIKINTIGGVIKPGMDILEIVPLDDTLLIEAKIRPQDIGFIHPQQKAMVKITAYDYSIYGGLEGKVEHISADTIVDDKDNSYYLIQVRTNKNNLKGKHNDGSLYIIPGMLASVDILTGKKSVMDYLLKPILKAKEKALRER